MRLPILRAAAILGGAMLLAGCQTLLPGGGMTPVAKFAGEELGQDVSAIRNEDDAARVRTAVAGLLKRPMTADTAVHIALLNNRRLQAAYNELGLAEADRLAASLPPNPVLSLSRIKGSGELEIERRIVADILALATLPARADIAADRFRQAQLRAVVDTIRVAMDARRAWYRAAAANELVGFLTEAQSAAEEAAQIAQRLGETGALNKLDQAREQVFYADIGTQTAAARLAAANERERLIRVLGLWGSETAFRLAVLPVMPGRPKSLPSIEVDAVRRRADLQLERIEVIAQAKRYGLTEATRFVHLVELGGVSKTTRSPDGEKIRQRGFEVDVEIPIFDFGQARMHEAEQLYMQAVNRLLAKATDVRSEARQAYRTYRAAYDIASHYQREVLPLRKIISDETLLRYNAMQIDVFSLLAEARQRIAATVSAIEARRAFFIAEADLFAALTGGGMTETASPSLNTASTTGQAAGH